MQKIYKEELKLKMADCDVNGQWRPGAMLTALQEAAGAHATMLGLGRNALIRKNIVWIITRIEVQMDRWPAIGENISIETFPMPMRRWFFPRYYIIRDAQDNQIGCAGSLWALLDLNTRKMVAPQEYASLLPDNTDLQAPLGLPRTVNEVAGTIEKASLMPVYTDLDVNGHVNNTRYIDWCCNALGIDCMKKQFLQHFALNYNMECVPGDRIETELHRLGNDFSYCGFSGGNRYFDIGGTLAERI